MDTVAERRRLYLALRALVPVVLLIVTTVAATSLFVAFRDRWIRGFRFAWWLWWLAASVGVIGGWTAAPLMHRRHRIPRWLCLAAAAVPIALLLRFAIAWVSRLHDVALPGPLGEDLMTDRPAFQAALATTAGLLAGSGFRSKFP